MALFGTQAEVEVPSGAVMLLVPSPKLPVGSELPLFLALLPVPNPDGSGGAEQAAMAKRPRAAAIDARRAGFEESEMKRRLMR